MTDLAKWKLALFIVLVLKLLLIAIPLREPEGGVLIDSRSYLDLAMNWEETGKYQDTDGQARDLVRPPGYPLFLRIAFGLTQESTWPIVLLQLILLGGSSLLLVWLGSLLKSPSIGLMAAGIFALNPNASLWALTIMTETSFSFFILASSIFLIGGIKRKENWFFIVSAIMLVVAIYIRPIGIILAPAWAILMLILERRFTSRFSLGLVGIFIVTIAVLIFPWLLRNDRIHGRFEFSSVSQKTLLGFNLAEVISQSEGIPRNEAVERINESSGLVFEAASIIRNHPVDFIKVQTLGVIRTVAGSDIGTWGNVLGWDTWKGFGLVSGLFNRDVGYGTDPFEASSGIEGILHRGLLLYSLMYSVILIISAFIGGVTVIQNGEQIDYFWIAAVAVAIFIVVPLASGQARFRVPASPFLAWMAATGLFRINKVRMGFAQINA